MSKVENVLEKIVELAKDFYQLDVGAHVDFFIISGEEYVMIDDIKGAEIFVCLFCANCPDEKDGIAIAFSEDLKNRLYDSLPVDMVEN